MKRCSGPIVPGAPCTPTPPTGSSPTPTILLAAADDDEISVCGGDPGRRLQAQDGAAGAREQRLSDQSQRLPAALGGGGGQAAAQARPLLRPSGDGGIL